MDAARRDRRAPPGALSAALLSGGMPTSVRTPAGARHPGRCSVQAAGAGTAVGALTCGGDVGRGAMPRIRLALRGSVTHRRQGLGRSGRSGSSAPLGASARAANPGSAAGRRIAGMRGTPLHG